MDQGRLEGLRGDTVTSRVQRWAALTLQSQRDNFFCRARIVLRHTLVLPHIGALAEPKASAQRSAVPGEHLKRASTPRALLTPTARMAREPFCSCCRRPWATTATPSLLQRMRGSG